MALAEYFRATRAPRYGILFAAPLFLLYEGAVWLSGPAASGVTVRNGAEVMLKVPFGLLGPRAGLVAFYVVLLGLAGALYWRDRRRHGAPSPPLFGGMALEALLYAPLFWLVVAKLTAAVLGAAPLALGRGQLIVLSFGAGLYEELVFRVLLVGALVWGFRRLAELRPVPAAVAGVLLGGALFSAAHYVGSFADRFTLESFVYRWIAGMVLSGLYVTRGFGITAWTHALYDVLVTASS